MSEISQQKKIQVARRIFEERIYAFGQFFFKNHLIKETPDFHKEILSLLESEKKRIVIAAPRSHAKSTLVDLVYLAWVIIHKKAKFVLLISDTYSQATLFLETLKAEFEGNDRLKSWYGNMVSNKWTEGEIIVNGIMIKALGAGMSIRGLKFHESRPDLIIGDDLENDEIVSSLERREKIERWWNGVVIPALDEETGRVIVIGTILHYDSLLAKMLKMDNYQEYDKKIYRVIMNGQALWPSHLNLDQIEKKKQEYIAKGLGFQFYREYMNDPVSDDNQKFQPEKMLFYKTEELENKLLANYMLIDRAYSTEKTADFTGIVIISVDRENNWYVRWAERFKENEKDLIEHIFGLEARWKPVKTGIEQKAFEYTLRPYLNDEMKRRNQFFKIEELKDLGRSKNLRIEGLIPRYESGSIFFLSDQIHLREEMERFPRGEHDDLLDGLSYGLALAEEPRGEQSNYEDIKELDNLDYREWV